MEEENNLTQPDVEETPAPEQTGEATTAQATAPAKKGFFGAVDNYFGITKSGSNYKREVIAGITTFMAMVYILMVNAGMFGNPYGTGSILGVSYGAMYIATAIGAIAGTMLMAFLAKMPLAQASGMGVNAFIVYTLCLGGAGLSYANCMVFTLIDGVSS